VENRFTDNNKDLRLEPIIDETPNIVPEFIMDDNDLAQFEKVDQFELDNLIDGYNAISSGYKKNPSPYGGDVEKYTKSPNSVTLGNLDLSDPDVFDYLMAEPRVMNPDLKKDLDLKEPMMMNKYAVNYDRYFMHPKFNELGFNPMYDMEKYYNENSTAWDDFSRTWDATWGSIKAGYLSAPRSVGDLFSGDPYFDTPDFQSASEFEQSTRIAQSTRGGFTGFANNTFNQLGYSIGMLGEILTEELLILGAAAAMTATGVGAPAGAATATVGTGRQILRLGKLGSRLMKFKPVGSLVNYVKRADLAKDFYNTTKAGGKWFANRLTPNSIRAINKVRAANRTENKLSLMAAGAKTFGGFYRDLRALNFAVSEGKLEAGLRYNEQVNMLAADQLAQNNGDPITPEQLAAIHDNALGSAVKTLHWNVPVIYLTNQLVFGKALRGFSPRLAKVFNPTKSVFNKELKKTAVKTAEGKIAKELLEDSVKAKVKESFGKRFKNIIPKTRGELYSSAIGATHRSLRLFAANLGEGTQELYQEAISAGFGEYYKDIYNDPTLAEMDSLFLSLNYAAKGTKSEGFSFETFASGFVVGGVMGGVNTFAMDWVPTQLGKVYRKADSKSAEEYQDMKEKQMADINEASTYLLSDQQAQQDILQDRHRINATIQNEAAREMEAHEYNGDEVGATDARDNALFHHLDVLTAYGAEDTFIEKLRDIKNLDDQDLIDYLEEESKLDNRKEARKEAEELVSSGRYRENIDKTIRDLEKYVTKKEAVNAKYVNPVNLSNYEKGTAAYANAERRRNQWEHLKLLTLYTSDGFDKARERSAMHDQRLRASKVLDKVSSNDILATIDPKGLKNELELLRSEIKALENAEDKSDLPFKKKKLEILTKYQEVLNDPKNQRKDGSVRRNEAVRKKISNVLYEYFNHVGSSTNDFVNKDELRNYVNDLLARYELDARAAQYNKTLNFLENPKNFTDLFERVADMRISDFMYSKESLVEAQKQRIERKERSYLLSEFSSLGVYPDPEEVKVFLSTGDVSALTTFYSATEKIITLESDTNKSARAIKNLLDIWNLQQQAKEARKQAEEKAEKESVETKEGLEQFKQDVFDGPITKKILDQMFLLERGLDDSQYLNMNDWLNSKAGSMKLNALASLKQLWSNSLNSEDQGSVYKEDVGFYNWIKENLNNPDVQAVFNEFAITPEDLIIGNKPEGKSDDFVKAGPNINIRQFTTREKDTDEDITYFKIVDNRGNAFPARYMPGDTVNYFNKYDGQGGALDVFNQLLPKFTKQSYKISDKTSLSFKDLVEDVNGKLYIMLGTSDEKGKGNELLLLPYEQRGLKSRDAKREASTSVPINQFEKRGYKKVEGAPVNYTNLSKLFAQEYLGTIPTKQGEETWDSATARYKEILSLLEPADIESIRVTIEENPFQSDQRSYKIEGQNANPFIKQGGNRYNIAIRLSQTTIEKLKNTKGLSKKASEILTKDNRIGFVRNGVYKLTDGSSQANPVDITGLSNAEIAKRYLKIEGTDKLNIAASKFRNNFIGQIYVEDQIDKLFKSGKTTVTLKELSDKGISLSVSSGQFSFDPNGKFTLDTLPVSTYEGSGVIIVSGYNFETESFTSSVILSEDVENKSEFRKEVTEKLKGTKADNSNLLDITFDKRGRYVAVVKNPNQDPILVDLQATPLEKEELVNVFKDLIDRSAESRDTNRTKEGEAKDKAFNALFNQQIQDRVYIASVPGSDITIGVSPAGNIEFEYYNHKVKDKRVKHKVTAADVESKYSLNNENLLSEFLVFAEKINAEYKDTPVETVSFNSESFRASFPKDATYETIVANTTHNMVFDGTSSEIRLNVDPTYESAMALALNKYISQPQLSQTDINEMINKIANKKSDAVNQPLSKEEQEFYNKYEEDINKKINDLKKTNETTNVNFGVNNQEDVVEEVTLEKSPELIQLEEQRNDLLAKQDEFLKMSREDRKKNKSEMLALEDQIEKVTKAILDINLANPGSIDTVKKSGSRLVASEVLAVDAFTEWAEKNLPDFINVQDIADLGIRLKNQNINVGQFSMYLKNIAGQIKVGGTIYTNGPSTVLYHEAFHGVFRLLLTPEQQAKFYSIAKKAVRAELRQDGSTIKQEINRLREQYPKNAEFTDEYLEKLVYEEWMADQFERFKIDPKTSTAEPVMKSWFNRLVEWVKAVFSRFTTNELTTLFEQIDAGKYKDAPVQTNDFTRHLQEGVTIDAYKNIQIGFTNAPQYLDPLAARDLTKLITARYISRAEAAEEYVVEDLLDDIIYDYEKLYDPKNEVYNDYSEYQKEQLGQVHSALTYKFGRDVKDNVIQYINSYITKIEKLKDVLEDLEASLGGRTTDQFDLDASNIGGHSALPFKVRVFIATQTVENVDVFGNPKLETGELLRVPVNFEDVFYGLTKAMSNRADIFDMINNAYIFSRRNKQTRTVLENLFKVTNINLEETIKQKNIVKLDPTKEINSQFFHQFIKSFRNEKQDYYVIHKDENAGTTDNPQTKVIQYSAAVRDAAKAQITGWRNNWFTIYSSFTNNTEKIEAAKEKLEKLIDIFSDGSSDKALEAMTLLKESTGIEVSPAYLEYSILQQRLTDGKKITNSEDQAFVEQSNKDQVDPITRQNIADLMGLITASERIDGNEIYKPGNIFSEEGGKDALSKITTFANSNALLDETIGVTVFLNAENNLVNAHQMPTFHLTEVRNLNNQDYVEDKVEQSNGYLDDNYLYNDAAFNKLQENGDLKVFGVDGQRTGNLSGTNTSDQLSIKQKNQDGTKFGSLSATDFVLNNVELYLNNFNNKKNEVKVVRYTDESTGREDQKALAPVLIRVMETANKGDYVSLPVVRAVEKQGDTYKLTEEALDFFYNDIKNEWNRINSEFKRHFPDGIISDNVDFDKLNIDRVTNYNTIDSEGQTVGIKIDKDNPNNSRIPRAFKFFRYSEFLSGNNFNTKLEEQARNLDITFEQALKNLGITPNKVRAAINVQVKQDVNNLLDVLKPNIDRVSSLLKGDIANRKDASLLNLTDNFEYNIAQIAINDRINTTALNDLLLGDQARLFKDPSIDATKRAKANNGAFVNVESYIGDDSIDISPLGDKSIQAYVITDKMLRSVITDDELNSTDAMVWTTVNGLAHFLHGLGDLNESTKALVEKVKSNEKITSEEWSQFKKDKAIFNSEKFVYFDGQAYKKMSVIPLLPELTTDKNGKAIQGREAIHNLRLSLEASEKKGKVSLAVPQSASKMLQTNVTEFDIATASETSFDESKPMLLNARHFGRQMVVPSNKTEITSLSQIKTLITSEQKMDTDVIINGKSVKVKDILKTYNNLAGAGVDFNHKNKVNLLFDLLPFAENLDDIEKSKMYEPNLTSFLRYAHESLKRAHASSTTLEYFSLKEDLETQFQKYELNTPLTIDKFQDLFLSFFGSRVLVEKVEGHTMALASLEMLVPRMVYNVADGKIDRQKVIRQSQFDNSLEIPKTLRADNYESDSEFTTTIETALLESDGPIVVLDRLRSNLKEYTDPTDPNTYTKQYYSEVMYPSHYSDVTDKIANTNKDIPEVIAKNQAVRVPSQDKHSAMNTKLVDFLPLPYGSTAVFAKEIVEITGADFDIDKAFISTKEWYINEDGDFVEYGTSSRGAETAKGKEKNNLYKKGYQDYANYVNKIVQKPGSYLAEALFKYNINQAAFEIKYDEAITMSASRGLSVLNLPTDFESYVNYREKNKVEPYNAAINNEVLDMKIALIGNESISGTVDGLSAPVAYTPLSMELIENGYSYLKAETPDLIDSRELSGVDIHSIYGKYKVWKTVKEAAGAIGTVVVPNLVINAMASADIKLFSPIVIDGKQYQNFSDQFVKTDNGERIRTQDTVDALVSAVVDDAKYNYLSRLGLNKPALRVATYMSGLGVPLNTTLLLLNVDSIQASMSDGISVDNDILKSALDYAAEKLGKKRIKELASESISKDELIDLINEPEDIDANIILENEVKALMTFKQFSDITKSINKIIPFFQLISDGHDNFKKIEDRIKANKELGLDIKNDKTFKAFANSQDLVADLRPLVKGDAFLSKYYDIHSNFVENILPRVFINFNPDFLSVYRAAEENFRDRDKNLNKNILSYFISKAYLHKVNTTNLRQRMNADSLTNAFLYDTEDKLNIVTTLEALQEKDPDKKNYFLNNYLFKQRASDSGNQSGINVVKSNTFGRVSEEESLKIQEGFQRIFTDPTTHREAMDFVNNQLVKDGLVYQEGTLIQSMNPTTLEFILSSAKDVMNVFNGIQTSEEVFGTSLDELKKELLMGYGLSPTVDKGSVDAKDFSIRYNDEEKTMTIESKVTDDKVKAKIYYLQYQKGVYRLRENLISDKVIEQGFVELEYQDSLIYDRVDHEGSYSQNPIGFIFGERPLTKDLGKTSAPVAKTKAPTPLQNKLNFSANTIEATEESINIKESQTSVPNFGVNDMAESDFGMADAQSVSTPQQASEVPTVAPVEQSIAVIDEYFDSEIAKIIRNSNNEAEDYLGRLVSKTTEKVEGGKAEQEVYENGTIQRILANDGSKIQRLIDNSGRVRGIPLINLTMDAKEVGLYFGGKKRFSLTDKQITEFFNSRFNKPTQQTSEVSLNKQPSLSSMVSAWLQTEEGSLDNQTPKESASKFLSEYTKRKSQLTDTGETVEELREKRKKMTREERLQDAGQLGSSMFDSIATGLNIYNTVLKEIERQNVSIGEGTQTQLNFGVNSLNVSEIAESYNAETEATENANSIAEQKITDFYNSEFYGEDRAKKILQVEKVAEFKAESPQDLIDSYYKKNERIGRVQSAEEFIDQIKTCYI
jgi:hypothetical protein